MNKNIEKHFERYIFIKKNKNHLYWIINFISHFIQQFFKINFSLYNFISHSNLIEIYQLKFDDNYFGNVFKWKIYEIKINSSHIILSNLNIFQNLFTGKSFLINQIFFNLHNLIIIRFFNKMNRRKVNYATPITNDNIMRYFNN